MMMRAALFAPLLVTLAAASAHADEVQTTTAGTVIVVTPSAPVVVPTAPAAAPSAAPGAVAEAAPVPAPAAPPQNEAWSNVSHINGTPVPVGERNRYLYTFRKTEISADPFGLMFGYYDVGVAHALSQNVAIAGSVTVVDHNSSSGYQLSASLPIYFRRAFSGPFLEPGVTVKEQSYSYDCYSTSNSSCGDTHRWAGPEMLFGWQWTFDSGLTVKGAFGAAKRASSSDGSSGDNAEAVGYFRVGYTF